MRVLLLVACTALALGGCGKSDQKDNNQIVDENLTAQNIVSNDVTAIDAVTGDAANMAADVDMNFGDISESAGSETRSPPKGAKAAPKNVTANGTETVTNAVANSTTNAQ